MLLHGRCLPGDRQHGRPRVVDDAAVLVDGDRIVDVGPAADLRARYPGARRVTVELITPGVHEAHAHPLAYGAALEELDLHGLSDPRAVADAVAERARAMPQHPGQGGAKSMPGHSVAGGARAMPGHSVAGGARAMPGHSVVGGARSMSGHSVAGGAETAPWLRGRGFLFDHTPDASLLDAAAPHHPVFLESRDLHGAWANRHALDRAGITRETPDPPAGRLLRDPHGRPTGYLLEQAVNLVRDLLPPPQPVDLDRGLDALARRGYVAAHAMAFEPVAGVAWAEARAAAGSLPLRLFWSLPEESWGGHAPGWRGADLEVAAVKLFADGSLSSRTAWMIEPYADGSVGMPLQPPAELLALGRQIVAAGFTPAIHAIGTRAVAEVVAVARELAPGLSRPLRLEHAQHIRDLEVAALAPLNVALSLQPVHLGLDAELVRRELPGQEREAFRLRDLWATGRPLAFGSDAPVAEPDLHAGIAAATQHALAPSQSLTFDEAAWCYTRGAALAAGWDDYGLVAPGARADLGLWEGERLVGRLFRGQLEWLSND